MIGSLPILGNDKSRIACTLDVEMSEFDVPRRLEPAVLP